MNNNRINNTTNRKIIMLKIQSNSNLMKKKQKESITILNLKEMKVNVNECRNTNKYKHNQIQ